jgi:hypothetical protein
MKSFNLFPRLGIKTFGTSLRDDSTSLKSKWKLAILVVWSLSGSDLPRLGRDHDHH